MTKQATHPRTTERPRYANPTIVEALCEIHFTLPDNAPWKASLAGDLFKVVQDDFPEMEPVIEIALPFAFGPRRGDHSLSPRQRMRFKHKTRSLLLQLGPNVFTFNVLPTYPGWEKMRQDVVGAWNKARSALNPASLNRIGLRFINRIVETGDGETPGEWFKASEFVPAGVLRSKGPFLSRVESQIDADNLVVVTLAEVPPDNRRDKKGIVFDIDHIVTKNLPLDDHVLLAEIDRLHEHVWEVFHAAQTPRLLKRLEGGVP